MFDYFRRLATTGGAYTASSVISKLFALALLPVYTRYLTPTDYGTAELLLASVIVLSIFVRLGLIEALMRFFFKFDDHEERARVVRSTFTALAITTTVGSGVAALFADQLSQLILDRSEPKLMLITILGLWVFTNYELQLAIFRLNEAAKWYFVTSIANVSLTIALTLYLVVGRDLGREGLLLVTSSARPASSYCSQQFEPDS